MTHRYTLVLFSFLLATLLLGLSIFPDAEAIGEALSASATTRVFQQGIEGYSGVADTYLDASAPDTPRGGPTETKIHAKESPWGAKRILIRYDLGVIPQYAHIVDARLELYVTERYPENPVSLQAYRLLKGWEEGTATWNATGLGSGWAQSGAGMSGSDYDGLAFSSPQITQNNVFVALNVTDAVRQWASSPEGNHGLLIFSGSSVDVRFWSSQASIEARRPRLTVVYEIPSDITPQPTSTSTPIHATTPGPTTSPPPASVIRSYGRKDALGGECIQTFAGQPATTEVLLAWRGQATSAKLVFYHANNSRDGDHHVLVNGTRVGRLTEENGRSKCVSIGLATRAEFPFDPALLRNGLNQITAVCDAKDVSGWSMADPYIEVGGLVLSASYETVDVPSTFDTTRQRATIQKPVGYTPDVPFPLVVALHGWGGNDYEAMKWMGKAANDRGWLLACPWIRRGSDHTASPRVQRDIIDLINYLVARPDYHVDTSRVYLVGRSMGGMIASATAAKYPDRFAALVVQSGPSDLASWYSHLCTMPDYAYHCTRIAQELNGFPHTVPFDYQRRSASAMPMNLRHVPTLIVHGTRDRVVPYAHGESLYLGMQRYGADRVVLASYDGGHEGSHPQWGPEEMLGFLSSYAINPRPLTATIRTDEAKAYYWFSVAYNDTDHWTLLDASFDPQSQTVTMDARDGRERPVALNIALDLAKLGLPGNVQYTIEEINLHTGEFRQYTAGAGPNSLLINVPRDHYRLVVHPYVAPQPHAQTLRRGNDGYMGVKDTFIEVYAQEANHGSEAGLYITGGDLRTPLLRFDLSHIPSNAVIKAAQLGLYAYNASSDSAKVDAAVYRLLESWDEQSATWQVRSAGTPWSKAGALGLGSDYEPNPSPPLRTLSQPGVWYRYNVTDLARGWVQDSSSNHGMLLRGIGGSGTLYLSSSESAINKPELIVVWGDPTPTPTPTQTATPTVTLTPTPTHTPTARPRVPIYLPMVVKNQ
ncbi:MAG: alpha/beta fold hydrolase [Chloroflexi bacterium]|nr:alpha/beta fold hydrolase [Chloroflexota bacterium]